MSNDDLRTSLARYAHNDSWCGWMKYFFSNAEIIKDVTGATVIVLPHSLYLRWERQMNTPFDELPVGERKSDYDEADKILAILGEGEKSTS